MAIYTKKGDKGTTHIFGKASTKAKEIVKDDSAIICLGNIDELNSFLGVAVNLCSKRPDIDFIINIQKNLLCIGSVIAGADLVFPKIEIKKLESRIDKLESSLPVLANFILPGGDDLGAWLHVCRSVARRTERSLARLNRRQPLDPNILIYVNRLSDSLFIYARKVSLDKGYQQRSWKSSQND